MTSSEVADHYNAVKEVGVEKRTESRIYHMRNTNNWIKSMLINEILAKLRSDGVRYPRVLDIGCGKGGDLRKWDIARISSIVMTDIADVSIEQARGRYAEMKARNRKGFFFPAEFIVADSTKDNLLSKYANPAPFDIASCQFSLHYSFCDEASAKCYLKNAVENLKPGGYFIGTLPDANRIVWAARQGNGTFKNAVCSISFENTDQLLNDQLPHFGAKFHFTLDEQVNCPEFLAHFPLLQKILEEEHDMELVFVRPFPDAMKQWMNTGEGRELSRRMKALERYPPPPGQKLTAGDEQGEYAYADEQLKKLQESDSQKKFVECLSKSEWEAVCMYLVFAFRKKRPEGEKEKTRKRPAPEVETEPEAVSEKKQKIEEKEEKEPQAEIEQTEKPAKE